MAQVTFFGGRRVVLPGTYSRILSGINNAPQNLDFGKVLIIDTGAGASFGGGSGINGTFSSGEDSIYQFNNVQDYRRFLKGGLFWLLANPLFKPNGQNAGVSTIYHIKAAETTAATMTFAPNGGGSNGGSITIQVRDEGVIGNGVLTNSKLTKGYGYTFEAGVEDPSKFRVRFWLGTWKGNHTDGISYDEVSQEDTKAQLLITSPEFEDIDGINNWMDNDSSFNTVFNKSAFTKDGDGSINSGDLTNISGVQVASGGTEDYSSVNLDSVLENIKELDYTFILCDDYGDEAQSALNLKILAHLEDTETRFEKFMIVGGGADSTKFADGVANSSIEIAQAYNNEKVTVVHGNAKKVSQVAPTGFREFPSIYKAAIVLGRMVGLEPQVPVTFKALDIDGEVHNLTMREREAGLQAGVLCTFFDRDFNEFIVLQGVNSLQNNLNLVNPDGTSFSLQLKRITAQLNRELEINSKLQLLNQQNGVNRNTLTAKNVEDWVKGYLQRRTATSTTDNLIISFRDVSVTLVGSAYNVTYGFVPNTEVNKLFFTGFILE